MHRQTLEIPWVWFLTTAIKQVLTFLAGAGSGLQFVKNTQHLWCAIKWITIYLYSLPHCQQPHQNGPLSTVDGRPSTQHYHPKSVAYIRVHPWCFTFSGFGQMYNDLYSPWYHTEYFHGSKKSSVFYLFTGGLSRKKCQGKNLSKGLFPLSPGNHWSLPSP